MRFTPLTWTAGGVQVPGVQPRDPRRKSAPRFRIGLLAGLLTLDHIASAPLNSDRLPSMRRRWVQYTTGNDPYEKVVSFCRAESGERAGSIREDRVLARSKL